MSYRETLLPRRFTVSADEHICLGCRGIVLPEGRQSEGHVAVRFDDHMRFGRTIRILYGSIDITNLTVEALAGRQGQGWAIIRCDDCPKGGCRKCGDELPSHRLTGGDVTVEMAMVRR